MKTFGLLLSLTVCALTTGCYAVPQGRGGGHPEGYYDRTNNRYWHAQAWHTCNGDQSACGGQDHANDH